jgi:hypothetical protein
MAFGCPDRVDFLALLRPRIKIKGRIESSSSLKPQNFCSRIFVNISQAGVWAGGKRAEWIVIRDSRHRSRIFKNQVNGGRQP